jgi:hypothetical protein
MKQLAIQLVKLLAIPLGCPKTATKWLVIGYQRIPFNTPLRGAIAKSLAIAALPGTAVVCFALTASAADEN